MAAEPSGPAFVLPLIPTGPPIQSDQVAPWAAGSEAAYDEAPTMALSAFNREASPAPVAVKNDAWQEAGEAVEEDEPDDEIDERPSYDGGSERQAVMRMFGDLMSGGEPDAPSSAPAPSRPSAPAAPTKKKKGIFGR